MTNPLQTILGSLTADQKRELEELGITQQRRSDWKHERRTPTNAQLVVLAHVAKVDPVPLLFWLAEEEANPAQRDLFRRVKESGSWARLMGIAAAILSGVSATPDPAFAQCSSDQTRFEPQVTIVHIVNHSNLHSCAVLDPFVIELTRPVRVP